MTWGCVVAAGREVSAVTWGCVVAAGREVSAVTWGCVVAAGWEEMRREYWRQARTTCWECPHPLLPLQGGAVPIHGQAACGGKHVNGLGTQPRVPARESASELHECTHRA